MIQESTQMDEGMELASWLEGSRDREQGKMDEGKLGEVEDHQTGRFDWVMRMENDTSLHHLLVVLDKKYNE